MAGNSKKTGGQKPAANSNAFQPTFRSYKSMNAGEQAAFRQGATTVSNKVKENLGLKKKRDE